MRGPEESAAIAESESCGSKGVIVVAALRKKAQAARVLFTAVVFLRVEVCPCSLPDSHMLATTNVMLAAARMPIFPSWLNR